MKKVVTFVFTYILGVMTLCAQFTKTDITVLDNLTKVHNEIAETDPENADNYNDWGNSLYDFARKFRNRDLYEQAIEKYRKAIEIDSSNAMVYSNLSNAMFDMGNTFNNREILQQSYKEYNNAVRSDSIVAKDNCIWGETNKGIRELKEKIMRKEKLEAKRPVNLYDRQLAADLLEDANNSWKSMKQLDRELRNIDSNYQRNEASYNIYLGQYEEASKYNPNDPAIYRYWAMALCDYANTSKKRTYYKESIEKIKTAAELDPDDARIFNTWGRILLDIAKERGSVKADKNEIEAKLVQADALKKNTGAYNLVRLYSLTEDKNKAIQWFETVVRIGIRSKKQIESDPDLDNIRQEPRFSELMNKYGLK